MCARLDARRFELTEHIYTTEWNTQYVHAKGEPIPDLSTAPVEQRQAPAAGVSATSCEQTDEEVAFYDDHTTVIEEVGSDEEAAEDELDTRAEWLGGLIVDKGFFTVYPKVQLQNEGPAWLIRACKDDFDPATTGAMEKITETTIFGDQNGHLSRPQVVKASPERPAYGVRGVGWKVSAEVSR